MKRKDYRYDLIHIHPAATRRYSSFMFMPAGLFGVLNEVRKAGYRLLMVNEPLEMLIDRSFDIADFLQKHPAACYSVDIHWHEHLYGGIAVARIIKDLYPHSTVIIGGLTASLYDNDILQLCPEIDFLISGYGEGCLTPIVATVLDNARSCKPGFIIKSNMIPDIDALDPTTRDFLLHHEDYLKCSVHHWDPGKKSTTFWLKNGLGCNKNCAFCGGSRSAQKIIFGNDRIIYRSPEKVAADIGRLTRQGVGTISLTHDIGAARQDYWEELHRLLRKEKIKCGVYIEAEDLPSDRFLSDFSRTVALERSVIALSPLFENEVLRQRWGKQFDNDSFWQCLSDLKKYKVQFVLYFVAGLFDHHLTSRIREMAFQKKIKASYRPLFIFNSHLTLDPGAPMYFTPEKYDIKTSLRSFKDYWRRCKRRSLNLKYDKFGYVYS